MNRPRLSIGLSLLSATLLAPIAASAQTEPSAAVKDVAGDRPVLEIVFVIDTTGSMGGLIEGAKQKVWGIVNEVLKAKDHPDVRVGLVAYRDRGDAYNAKVLPLTKDLDKVYTTLMDYQAQGGGDGPEDVRHALAEGVQHAGWSPGSPKLAQILFLVGDAPPHDDYLEEPDTLKTAAEAVSKGLIVNAIQCGSMPGTKESWEAIARRGEGRYFAIAQDGGVQVVATPEDKKLGELSAKLGGTFLAYGGGGGREGMMFRSAMTSAQAKSEAKVLAAAPAAAVADRALNKVINPTAYVGDLLQAIENGSTTLEAVKADDLPDELKAMTSEARKKAVEAKLADRKAIRAEISELSKKRDAYIAEERRKKAAVPDGFDAAVSSAIRDQAAKKGLRW